MFTPSLNIIPTPERLETTRTIIRSLNADARIIETTEARVPLDAILRCPTLRARQGVLDLRTA
jgi:G3E family GTPase